MDINTACFLLDISPDELYDPCTGNLDHDRLKRQYRSQSLRLHPDKNPAPDASERFQCMHEAYVYISTLEPDHGNNWTTLWTWLQEGCEEHIAQWIDRQDKDTLFRMHELLSHPMVVRQIGSLRNSPLRTALDHIHSLLGISLKSKCSRDQTMVLRPTLSDILQDQVFRLVVEEKTYWIPLWVEELVYDLGQDHELIVQCVPDLPSNVVVDEIYHHLYVSCVFSIINDVWGHDELVVAIELLSYTIKVSQLRITPLPQKILLSTHGIPRANPDKNNVYDVSRRGSIYAWITLTP